ncbi:uncharacterized protein TNCV_2608371 [Trichonephila clavipes]|uniref:Uncharacterized protein n=1 Tax=Trichonephila clavipes TaxID=2585209 RepID=A0A8X6V704_TRICX|nr:uncharacterized protein TNCV_2608371 [Trichonephila clavipes]
MRWPPRCIKLPVNHHLDWNEVALSPNISLDLSSMSFDLSSMSFDLSSMLLDLSSMSLDLSSISLDPSSISFDPHGSSDNGSLRDESSGFDRVQRRSNDSRDGKKKGSEVKRELEEKGLSFTNNQGEKHTNKTNKRGPLIRSIPSSWSEKGRMIKKSKNQKLGYKRANESRSGGPERKVQKGSEHRVPKRNLSNYTNSVLPKYRKKSQREETITPTTSGYNLRTRKGKREESRPTIERKTLQGGPVRSRKGRERNDSPYIEERKRSGNKNAR